jgi:hypothetical protein
MFFRRSHIFVAFVVGMELLLFSCAFVVAVAFPLAASDATFSLCAYILVAFGVVVVVVSIGQGSGWKPTSLTSVFSLRTSILLPPDGTTPTAFAVVNTDVAGC